MHKSNRDYSLPMIGKFLGAVIVGPMIERWGHRLSMAITCCVQVVGTVSEFNNTPTLSRIVILTLSSPSNES